jgi:ribosomal protein L32
MTQSEWVLHQLKMGRKLTGLDAFRGCGTLKLPNRICDLKAQGHLIGREMIELKGKRFARYYLIKEKK